MIVLTYIIAILLSICLACSIISILFFLIGQLSQLNKEDEVFMEKFIRHTAITTLFVLILSYGLSYFNLI